MAAPLHEAIDINLGTDAVTAVYLGEDLVWPDPVFLGLMVFLPDDGD